ncbi:MAG TPA: potassium-transporting ATPase subunit B, partial [Dehalococcoidia bacterium]|nr:potassium-transporting ATPase subunit B [Dehalococcoidia bacterium]
MTAERPSAIARERKAGISIFRGDIIRRASLDSILKLNPVHLMGNPVMFVVEIGAVITSILFVDAIFGSRGQESFTAAIAAWLWFTVLFANFAEAMAEGRGKAQANTLRTMRRDTTARREQAGGGYEDVPAASLRKGDVIRVQAGEIIASDGAVIEGVAFVSEAAITGESAPVLKEPGTDIRSSVTGGTTVTSDWLRIRVTSDP